MPAPHTILIVDDNVPALKATSRILEKAGYEVTQATDGAAALREVRAHRPSLVLLDVVLPGLSGPEVLRQIRADPALARVSVVLLSSQLTTPAQQAEGLDAGADGYIARPIASAELLARVRSQLRQSELSEQLRASEERLRIVTENARVGLVMLDRERRYTFANSAYSEILGLASPDLRGQRVADVLAPLYEAQIRAPLDRAFAGERVAFELHKPAADGDSHYAVKYEPTKVDGVVSLVVVVITDVTERKRAETAALRLAAIVESSDDAIIGMDLNGSVTSWNRGAENIFGYPPGEMVGTSMTRLIPADRRDEEEHILGKIRRGESVQHVETLRKTRDGRLIDVSITASPIRDATGAVIGVSKVARNITGRKRAETALRLFRTLVDQSNDTFEVVDPESGGFLDVNENACTESGYSRAEFLALRVWDIDPLVQEADWPQIAATIRTTGLLSREGLHRRKNGTTHPVELNAKWVHLDRDYIVASVRDITRRKQTEAARQASEGRYRALFEHAPDGIVIADPGSTYLDANASICRMLGYTRDELIGRNASDIAAPNEIAHIETALSAIKARSDYHREWQFRRKDGSVFAAEVIATLLPDGNLLGMIRDITERKQAEEALRESELRLRQVVENIHEVFWIVDLTGHRIAYISPRYEAIWGRTCESLYASPGDWVEAIHPEDRARVLTAFTTQSAAGTYDEEYRIERADGGERWIRDRGFPVKDERGTVYRIAGVAEDITERKQLEAQFLRAQRLESIGTLAGGIAHDLNNVLSPIILSLDLLASKFTDPESTELLETISSSARRGSAMVRQVLSFARGIEGERQELQVRHLIREIEKIVNDTFLKNVRVRTSVPNDLRTVVGDATQLHQVLMNLCVNARDAMPDGGTLTISAENVALDAHYAALHLEAAPGPYVLLRVTDSGTGMPPAVIEKIFDPFFTTKEIGKGTGLGLSTSLGIIKSHGGFIRVESKIGKGTTFQVYLPALTENSPDDDAGIAAEMPRGHGELILVVDDEAAVRQITQQTLEAFGYRAVVASDGAEAVAIFARQGAEIAVVLTDMMMPILDGPATIRVLRRMNPAVRIIAASGLSSHGHAAPGVKHFLAKPYTAELLLKALRQVLSAEA